MEAIPVPSEVKLTDSGSVLEIEWSDGQVGRHRLAVLRAACPCAHCQGHDPSESLNLRPEDFEDIRLDDLRVVGRYAFQAFWSDGHGSGYYQFASLRAMGNSA